MFRRLALFCAVLAVSPVLHAQEPSALPTNHLEEVVVTGTRIPAPPRSTPTSVSVVTRDEIEEQQIRTVDQVLRDEAGVDVSRAGQPGGVTSVFLRGANANQTLVLIDGVRVNNAFNNAFDFANLPVDNIDHIEILRGPQGTLYGSEALGGVINIVTKQPTGKPTGSALVEGGSDDGFRTRESFAGKFDKLSLSAETSYFSTDNERINSEFRDQNNSGRATYQLLDRLSVSLLGTYEKSHAGSPNDRFTNDPNDFYNTENSRFALTLDGEVTEWWNAKVVLSHDHERGFFSGLEPNPPFFLGDYIELTVVDRDQIDFQNIFTIGSAHKILIGGTYDTSHANDNNTYGQLDRTVDDKAVYAQYEFTPIDRFTATAGGRVDDYTTFGAHSTYRFGARYTTPVTETILRANVGTGFRAPTIRDFFPPFGNPNLKPEENLGWDVGAEQPLADGKLCIGVTHFRSEVDDLIVNAFPAPLNIGKARTFGIESFATWTPLTNLTLRGSYTWLDARDTVNDQRLIRRPEHSGNVSAAYRFLERFTANASAGFVGPRPDSNFSTFPAQRVTNAGYIRIDLGLNCDVCQHFSVFGRVENLIDDKYEEVFGFPALGRVFRAGGVAKF